MDFKYTESFTISTHDLNLIVLLVQSGLSVDKAIKEWSTNLDEVDKEKLDSIFDLLVNEIHKFVS